MKLIAPFFETKRIKFSLQISPKIGYGLDKSAVITEKNKPMIKPYVSKAGLESLIFSPTVGLMIQAVDYTNSGARVVVPIHLVYQFGGILSNVYGSLIDKDWYYIGEDRVLCPIANEVQKRSKKISLFKTMMVMSPTIITDQQSVSEPGIQLKADGLDLGCLVHYETRALIDTINHMDITTYTLLAGLTEKVDSMDRKLDTILEHFSASV